jgi:hypothetical protein
MYKAYFSRRLLEALILAEQATSAKERSAHLRASDYYRALLRLPSRAPPPETSRNARSQSPNLGAQDGPHLR